MARLTITSTGTEILTTAEAKTHLRVTHSAEDTYIETLIKVAQNMQKNIVQVHLLNQLMK